MRRKQLARRWEPMNTDRKIKSGRTGAPQPHAYDPGSWLPQRRFPIDNHSDRRWRFVKRSHHQETLSVRRHLIIPPSVCTHWHGKSGCGVP